MSKRWWVVELADTVLSIQGPRTVKEAIRAVAYSEATIGLIVVLWDDESEKNPFIVPFDAVAKVLAEEGAISGIDLLEAENLADAIRRGEFA